MTLRYIINRLTLAFIAKAGSNTRIRYWRRQGVKIGDNCFINNVNFSTEPYLIEIGNHVAIAAGTDFITHDGAIWCFREEMKNADVFGKIKVGNNVFIGNNCTILPNTSIGDNSIIGAGSTVRGQFPENSVIVGNPAKVVLSMSMQKLLYMQNPNFLEIRDLAPKEKSKAIRKHFGLQ
ncbi:MAG: putative acetyltransferase [Bacteroidetes bacterium ADurb.Bin145]|jgi:acetyltransferase-like isoleucine patch superfamily enzyme|nr:MAG: putative acetyltransferase [Bacteroidetes bacterium ADurb.Bin145]